MADAKARLVLEKFGLKHLIRKFDNENITDYWIPNICEWLLLNTKACTWKLQKAGHRKSPNNAEEATEDFLCKKQSVLKSFSKFTGKHLPKGLFFNKVY